MVSICIPAYENPSSLNRLLMSIDRQTYNEYEIIITDDSRDDKVSELVAEFYKAKKNVTYKYEKNEKQLGPTANTNHAISFAKGDYIKIMHHDDYFEKENSLALLVEMLEKSGAAIAFSGTLETEYDGDAVVKSEARCISAIEESQLKNSVQNLFLVNMIGAPSATLIRRNLLVSNNIQMDESLKWLVDIDYYWRILEINPNYVFSKEPLINIGRMQTQVTKTCLDDEDLIFSETRYVYTKYKLGSNERHVRYICTMGAKYHKKYNNYKGTGISYSQYLSYKIRYNIRRILKIL